MNQAHGLQSSATIVLLLIVSLGAIGLSSPGAEAQVPAYTITGTVFGADDKALSGAAITILKADGASAGSATTDANGKYSVGSLVSGTYKVSAAHACCDKQSIPVEITGTDPTVQQNFRLTPPAGSPAGADARVLKGVARDDAGAALAGVVVEVYNYAYNAGSDGAYYFREPNQKYFTATTAADGTYSFSVAVGSVSLTAKKDGFDRLHANFEMKDNRTLDLPMRKSEAQSVTIQGTIKSDQGGAAPNAWVSVGPNYDCGYGDGREIACAQSVQDPGGTQQGDVWFYYEAQYGQYNSTQADANGKYSLRVAPGMYRVSAWAENHRGADATVTAKSGETKTVDLTLQRIPDDTVRLQGNILDAATGKGIPYASLNVENQQWGSYHGAMTKEDGSFELMVKPGYLIVTARADRFYYSPCGGSSEPRIMPAEDQPASESAKPSPPDHCDGSHERASEYYPVSLTFTVAEKEEKAFDAKLQARPAPDATFYGYVVNASSEKAVPNARVSFFNEFTRDWGEAVTDENGGYKIRVHAGYYSIRASADHFYDAAVNAQIGGGKTERLDVFVTPGEKSYGCCYMYGGYGYRGEMSVASSGAKSSGGPPMPMTTSPPSDSGADGASGQAVYQGESDSGLGEYRPYSGAKGTSPGAVGPIVLALLAGLAIVLRRRTA